MTATAIFGAGGLGKEALALLRTLSPADLAVFTDDDATLVGRTLCGIPVVATDALAGRALIIAVAAPAARYQIAERFSALPAMSLLAPSLVREPGVCVGEGALISHFALISSDTVVGRFCHMNYHAVIAHDCVVGDFVTLGPRATICGNVHIGDGAYIGAGALVRQGRPGEPLSIGAGATIGMGAVVTRSVAAGDTVVGNPARPLPRRS